MTEERCSRWKRCRAVEVQAPHAQLPQRAVAARLTTAAGRYYANHANIKSWPPEVHDYNESFTRCLETIKKRHDAVVTTVGECTRFVPPSPES